VALLVVTAACSASGDQALPAPGAPGRGSLAGTTITFSVGLDKSEIPAIQELLKRFEREQSAAFDIELVHRFRRRPGVTVNLVTSLTRGALDRQLEHDVGAGKPKIELFARDNVGLETLVQQGMVEDISQIAPPTVGAAMPGLPQDRQFFVPFRPNVRLAYANKDRFRQAGVEPPRTVEEFLAVAEKLKAAAGRPKVTLSLAQGEPAAVTISEWILGFGGDPLVLNDAPAVAAFESLQRLWEEGVLARESVLAQYDTEIKNLAGETAWLAQNWSYTSSQLARQGALGKFQVYPGWEGPKGSGHVIGGDVLGIPRGVTGKQRQAAMELIRFLLSEQSQQFLARANSWPSVLPDTYRHVDKDQRETFAAIQAALDTGWAGRSVWYWCHVSYQMNEAVTRTLMGHEPVKPVLDELQAKVDAAKREGTACPPSE
jgi:trehalose transport system substrate-binding protein